MAFPLPLLVICELLGVPFADRDRFRRWSEMAGTISDREQALQGRQQLSEYMAGLVEHKKEEPGDDVITRMVELSPPGSEDDIAQLGGSLLFAGHKTTVVVIDRGVLLLGVNPGRWAALRDDPSRIPCGVEEFLRHRSPVSTKPKNMGMPRYAMADLEIDGVHIAAGELLLLAIHEAIQDEERFPDPEAFDPGREPNPHLTFGHGPRFCVGAPLSCLELTEVFAGLVTGFGTFGVAADIADLPLRRDKIVGGVGALPVRWERV